MASKKNTSIADVTAFLDAEIKEYTEALAFVLAEQEGPNKVQYSRLFARKRAEYEGGIAALNDVAALIRGDSDEAPSSNPE